MTKKALLIAEKPSLMRDIQKVYNKKPLKDLDVDFASFVGHVMGLQEPKEYTPEWEKWDVNVLPMIPSKFVYTPSKNTMDVYKDLVKKIKNGNYDYIINACDAGREGQHIFHAFYDTLNLKTPILRFWVSSQTDVEIEKALNNLIDYSKDTKLKNMTYASKARSYFDWLVGLNSTRALTVNNKHFGYAVPVGRVMTPTLRILVDRELEIRNFVPKPFWEIKGTFNHANGKYVGTYFNSEEEEPSRLKTKEKALAVINSLSKNGVVKEVSKKKETKYAPNLPNLQSISSEANIAFGYTMDETLAIVQALYEKKIVSYPRTDSQYITPELAKELPTMLAAAGMFPELKSVVDGISAQQMKDMASNKKYVDAKKVTDHYAIVPTGVKVNVNNLPKNEYNIFILICKRLVAIFMNPNLKEKTEIITEVDSHLFKSIGSVLIDNGYLSIYATKSSDNLLPAISKKDSVEVDGTDILEKKTTPPSRFNDSTLGNIMENAGRLLDDEEMKDTMRSCGLGTSATRGGIVKKLITIGMLKHDGKGKTKNIVPTDYGINLIKALGDRDITKVDLTAEWEGKIQAVEEGRLDPRALLNEMIEYTKDVIDDLKGQKFDIHNPNFVPKKGTGGAKSSTPREVIGKCPSCGNDVFETDKFYLCNEYKKTCQFLISKTLKGAKIPKTEMKKILAGKETKELTFEWSPGKKGEAKLKYENGKLNFIFPPRK